MKKKFLVLMLALCSVMMLAGCGNDKKIAELKEEFDSAMDDKDYDEAKDILDEMKDLDKNGKNEDVKDAKKEYKKVKEAPEKDAQLCDTYRTAICTALSDPVVINENEHFETSGRVQDLIDSCPVLGGAILDIVGDAEKDKITDGDIMYMVENGCQITVYIEGSDRGDGHPIGAGPHIGNL